MKWFAHKDKEVDHHVAGETNQQAQELTAKERQHEHHLQESLLERSAKQVDHS